MCPFPGRGPITSHFSPQPRLPSSAGPRVRRRGGVLASSRASDYLGGGESPSRTRSWRLRGSTLAVREVSVAPAHQRAPRSRAAGPNPDDDHGTGARASGLIVHETGHQYADGPAGQQRSGARGGSTRGSRISRRVGFSRRTAAGGVRRASSPACFGSTRALERAGLDRERAVSRLCHLPG